MMVKKRMPVSMQAYNHFCLRGQCLHKAVAVARYIRFDDLIRCQINNLQLRADVTCHIKFPTERVPS